LALIWGHCRLFGWQHSTCSPLHLSLLSRFSYATTNHTQINRLNLSQRFFIIIIIIIADVFDLSRWSIFSVRIKNRTGPESPGCSGHLTTINYRLAGIGGNNGGVTAAAAAAATV
jgi:hypothetical protein